VEKCDLDSSGNDPTISIAGREFHDYWAITNFLRKTLLHAATLVGIKKSNSSWHVPEIMQKKNENNHVLQF
jgi:hypothetical protein